MATLASTEHAAARSPRRDALLSVRRLGVRFGGVTALDGVDFDVAAGEVCALIGPNGAGKTTAFNVISGLQTPTSGSISFDGVELVGRRAHRIAQLGVSRTFQHVALAPSLTVRENVLLGAHDGDVGQLVAGALGLPAARRRERADRREADRLLGLLGLEGWAGRRATGLPYGTLKRVELARALLSRPRLVMLDEPAAGLNHSEVAELGRLLRRVHRELELTTLLVEHHMSLVMEVSDHVVVLDFGRKIAEGTPDDVRRHPAVIEAYLGSAA